MIWFRINSRRWFSTNYSGDVFRYWKVFLIHGFVRLSHKPLAKHLYNAYTAVQEITLDPMGRYSASGLPNCPFFRNCLLSGASFPMPHRALHLSNAFFTTPLHSVFDSGFNPHIISLDSPSGCLRSPFVSFSVMPYILFSTSHLPPMLNLPLDRTSLSVYIVPHFFENFNRQIARNIQDFLVQNGEIV